MKNPHSGDMKTTVSHLQEQMFHAIALSQMHQLISYSPKVDTLFNDTREAFGYAVIQQSVLFELGIVLCRFYDESNNTMSFPTLFNHEDDELGFQEWFSKLSKERRTSFSNAQSAWSQVKGSHLLSKTRNLRHKFWAHSAQETQKVQLPKYDYIDELCSKTKGIVKDLALAILDMDTDFDEAEQVWKQRAHQFFEVLTAGQQGQIEKEKKKRQRQLADLGGTEKRLRPVPRRRLK